jgi:hypothetical protein
LAVRSQGLYRIASKNDFKTISFKQKVTERRCVV